jgi:hypothetical protein
MLVRRSHAAPSVTDAPPGLYSGYPERIRLLRQRPAVWRAKLPA